MKPLDTRVYFVANNRHWSLAEARASPEAWKSFLADLGVAQLAQGDLCMGQTVCLLLRLGLRIERLQHWPDGEDRFLLQPTFASMPLTCQDLAREGRWDTTNCCQECHGGQRGLIEHSLEDQRVAYLCCHASFYLDHK